MKKIYTVFALVLSVGWATTFAQTSFQLKIVETKVHSDTITGGDIEIDGNYIINKTAGALDIDVIRLTDVGGTWTSAFCLDICYAPFIDSVRYTIPVNDSITLIPHFYIDATPDSQCVYMKVKSVSVPTDIATQWFCGITKIGFGAGVHEYSNLANVSMYPVPVTAGKDFRMNISNIKGSYKNFSLALYNIYGSRVKTIGNLTEGNNTLTLDLPAGLYSYSLVSGDVRINSGNITVSK